MDPVVSRVLNYLTQEWHVIRRAPIALVIIGLIGVGVGWKLASTHYEGIIREKDAGLNTAEQRLLSKDEHISSLEKQLGKQGVVERRGDRHVSKEEEREVIRLLSALGPHGVIVGHENGNDEAYAFAEELVVMFKAIPGWKVQGSNFVTRLGPRKTGVFFIVSKQGEVPQAVHIVMASLKKEGIAFELEKQDPTPQNHLSPRVFEIFVRGRP